MVPVVDSRLDLRLFSSPVLAVVAVATAAVAAVVVVLPEFVIG